MLRTLPLSAILLLGLVLLPAVSFGARPAGCAEWVVNGGFEAGSAGWTSQSNGVPPRDLTGNFYPYRGAQGAILAGANNADDRLAQQITLPAAATEVRLTFWWSLFTEEAPGAAFDTLRVQLFQPGANSPLTTTLSVTNDSAESLLWNFATADLAAYAGQTVELRFTGTSDGNRPTTFFFDEVSVTACGGSTETPTPTATLPPTPTLTASPSVTPAATASLTPTPTSTATPTATPTVTATATLTSTRAAQLYLPSILR